MAGDYISWRLSLVGGLVGLSAIVAAAGAELPASAFVNIADTTTGELSNLSDAAINNAGLVAFAAQIPAGGRGVYTGSTSTPPNDFGSIIVVGAKDSIGRPAINNAGLVAVRVSYDIEGHRVIVGASDSFDIIADNTGPALIMGSEIGINDSGEVVFSGSPKLGSATQAIHIGSITTPTNTLSTIATLSDGLTSLFAPDISSSGLVSFTGRSSIDLGWRVYTGGVGQPVSSVEGSGSSPFRPAINDSDATAFYSTASGLDGFYINDATGTNPFVTIGDGFISTSTAPAFNNQGVVAFVGTTSAGVGLYAGPDPVADRLIGVGDALFGSTITSLQLARDGLNDAGQLAFEYSLANGVEGIAVVHLDSDGDGLLDIWEAQGGGIDSNGDGIIDLDLPAMGARPDRKDIFIEIDAMAGRAPTMADLQPVIDAFDQAPVPAPPGGGQGGIALHLLIDETSIPRAPFPNDFADFDTIKTARFGTAAERADPNWPNIKAAREAAFRYCIFADTYGGSSSSGLAELPGDDFMVTLGGWPTPGGTSDQKAGTFMHELGHNLGLDHGGGDGDKYKPNYYSVMNYRWQTPQSRYAHLWRLDYSREALPPLVESALDESISLGATRPEYATVEAPFTTTANTWGWAPLATGQTVDWNGDGTTPAAQPVSADINRALPADAPGSLTTLTSHDDWANLRYALTGHPNFGDGRTKTTIDDEFDLAEFAINEQIPPPPGLCPADLNGDGMLNFFDVSAFLTAFTNMDPLADLNGDGMLNFFDVSVFLTAFNAGCP